MTHYVLCYAHPSFDHGGLLPIEKRKPVWQSGKWNFPGGKIESGESISLAAIRELREETNVVTRSPFEGLNVLARGSRLRPRLPL